MGCVYDWAHHWFLYNNTCSSRDDSMVKGKQCSSCIHNIACRHTKKACTHFQILDMHINEDTKTEVNHRYQYQELKEKSYEKALQACVTMLVAKEVMPVVIDEMLGKKLKNVLDVVEHFCNVHKIEGRNQLLNLIEDAYHG